MTNEITNNFSNGYPILDMQTIHNYCKNNIDIDSNRLSDEISTVSSVRVWKKKKTCVIKANINDIKLFHNRIVLNKKNAIVSSHCSCTNTTAAPAGVCKHVVTLLFWLQHKTSTETYEEYTETNEQCTKTKEELPVLNLNLRENQLPSLDLRILAAHYKNQSGDTENIEEFINFCKLNFDENAIEETIHSTINEANSKTWINMRSGRITASSIYVASNTQTLRGSLFKSIMGKVRYNRKSVNIGHRLEERVLRSIEKKYKMRISRVGLHLSKDYPIFGASPDGLTPEYCIEIKCPKTMYTYGNYVREGYNIPNKIMAQLQLQMLLCKRDKGLFCLVDPNFRYNNKINIIEVDFNETFIKDLMNEALVFWGKSIFPELMQN